MKYNDHSQWVAASVSLYKYVYVWHSLALEENTNAVIELNIWILTKLSTICQ